MRIVFRLCKSFFFIKRNFTQRPSFPLFPPSRLSARCRLRLGRGLLSGPIWYQWGETRSVLRHPLCASQSQHLAKTGVSNASHGGVHRCGESGGLGFGQSGVRARQVGGGGLAARDGDCTEPGCGHHDGQAAVLFAGGEDVDCGGV